MGISIILDWKSFAAIGGAIVAAIFVSKLDTPAVAQVSNRAVDACKEAAVAYTTHQKRASCFPSETVY